MSRIIGVQLLVATVSLAMVAAVVAAIVVIGPPSQQRLLRLDAHRVTDLTGIAQAIGLYANRHERLPSELATLTKEPGPRINSVDPEARTPYEYAITGEESYRLCAVFSAASRDTPSVHTYLGEDGWTHDAGRQCFERKEKVGKQ